MPPGTGPTGSSARGRRERTRTGSRGSRQAAARWAQGLAFLLASCVGTPGGEGGDPLPPPRALSVLHPRPQVLARAECPADGERAVHITWRLWDPDANQRLNLRGTELQRVPVDFQPTALEFLGSSGLLVAGLAGGVVILEHWTLANPFDAPPGEGRVGAPRRRRVAQLSPGEVRGPIVQMVWNRALRNGVFLIFQGGRDLHELRWGEGAEQRSLRVVARGQEFPVVLGRPGSLVRGGDHLKAGFVYAFGVEGRVDRSPSLLLRDEDRDGEIDERLALSLAELDAFGFTEPRAWRELDGRRQPPVSRPGTRP